MSAADEVVAPEDEVEGGRLDWEERLPSEERILTLSPFLIYVCLWWRDCASGKRRAPAEGGTPSVSAKGGDCASGQVVVGRRRLRLGLRCPMPNPLLFSIKSMHRWGEVSRFVHTHTHTMVTKRVDQKKCSSLPQYERDSLKESFVRVFVVCVT